MTPDTPYSVLRYRQRVYSRVSPYFYGDTLFDSGCGDGGDDILIAPYFKKIHGMDIKASPLWKDRASDKISFSTGNTEKLDFPDSSFDTVLEKDMLHHASDPVKGIREMVRISKKRVIIIECNRYNPLLYINMTLLRNHQHFTQKKFGRILESAGAPYEIKHFSARHIPVNSAPAQDFFEKIEDLLEKLPFYTPIIEYNLGILSK
jgi:ubiquinone/menaquinone biosynthesis C-methylase UbiE